MRGLFFKRHHLFSEIGRVRHRTIATALLGLIVVTLLISGCTMVGPDYVKPEAPEPEKWLESTDPKIESKETDFSEWWTVFSDPILNDLIQAAYQQNLPLQIAGIRIYEARAQTLLGLRVLKPEGNTQLGSSLIDSNPGNLQRQILLVCGLNQII